jgi:hypothetical protein
MSKMTIEIREVLTVYHQVVIETELSTDELYDKIEELELESWDTASDIICKLEDISGMEILEVIEQDPEVDETEIIDIKEVKEDEK